MLQQSVQGGSLCQCAAGLLVCTNSSVVEMGTINKTQPARVLCHTQCLYASITTLELKISYPAYSLKLVSDIFETCVLDIAFSKALRLSKYLCVLIFLRKLLVFNRSVR